VRRRAFIIGLGAGAFAPTLLLPSFTARAQQQRPLPVVGLLSLATSFGGRLEAFRQSLSEAGFDDGRNVTIENSWDGRYDRLPERAADLARRRVSVIVATSTPGALAAKAATSTVPIVFSVGVDPVEAGLVSSLSRPGGNLTGVSILNVELGAKQLELLHEVVPAATKIALLVNPTSPALADPLSRQLQAAARSLALELQVVQASSVAELEAVFGSLRELQVAALVIASDPFLNGHSELIAALALRHAMPTMHQYREFPAAGGLMGYGGAITDSYRLVGEYTGRILKGEKPADLPVQQLTKVELIVNLKTAKALGLNVPLAIIGRADEVIE
jgi:putative tryptophan/tyrosine transport system substrate-binding protein